MLVISVFLWIWSFFLQWGGFSVWFYEPFCIQLFCQSFNCEISGLDKMKTSKKFKRIKQYVAVQVSSVMEFLWRCVIINNIFNLLNIFFSKSISNFWWTIRKIQWFPLSTLIFLLKVSKSRKQILKFSFAPIDERKYVFFHFCPSLSKEVKSKK